MNKDKAPFDGSETFKLLGDGGVRNGEIRVVGAANPGKPLFSFTPIEELLDGGLSNLAKMFPADPIPEGIRKIFAGESGAIIGQAEQRYLFGGGKSSFYFHQIVSNKILANRLTEATWEIYDFEHSSGNFQEALLRLKKWVDENAV